MDTWSVRENPSVNTRKNQVQSFFKRNTGVTNHLKKGATDYFIPINGLFRTNTKKYTGTFVLKDRNSVQI